VEFRILGPLEVVAGGRPVQLTGARERALLAILLIHAAEVVSADRLIDELWGDDLPGNPSNALQVVVSRVRRALDGELLVTRKPGYVLHVDTDSVDARRFGRLVAEAERVSLADQARRSSLLAEALGLWRGPALAEFALDGFARDEVTRLEEARIRAVELKTEADLALGRHAELAGELKALVAAHPLRERLRGQLMLALYRSGRQGEALRVFQEGRTALADELGVDPGAELQELHQQILLQAASLSAAPQAGPAPRDNLPAPVTSFVGRRAEFRAATELLKTSRLVTLTGAGGCGKTRLALEVATGLVESFADGVWLAELEAVSDAALVPGTLAAVLGIGDGGSLGVGGEAARPLAGKLLDYLREKELLVVLDNCEHLIDACAELADRVLKAAPKVRFLATSRERLDVAGEALLPVLPLAAPGPHEVTPEQLAESDAARLFADRAAAVQPAFRLDQDTAAAVAHICRRLDGIPLALELAAARVRVIPPQEIAARLDDRFSLLTSANRSALARHQTLRAAIDWSYDLLSGPERELFGRLSVFAGGVTLEAAESVCGYPDTEQATVLDLLSRLVDQSLVIPDRGGQARFRMLETLRRYAGERLTESGTAENLRRRHAECFLRLAEQAEPLLRGPQQAEWLRRLDAERDNIGAAIDWAFRRDPEMAVRLSSALAYFWLIGRHRSEVRRRLADAVETACGASPASRSRALAWAAQLGCVEGPADQAAAQAREARDLAVAVGDPWWIALCEAILGLATGLSGDPVRAGQLLDASGGRFRQLGDAWGTALASMFRGLVTMLTAQFDLAAALARQGLDDFRSAGDQWGQTMTLELLALLARQQGRYDEAIAASEEALGVVRELGLRDEASFLLADLGDLHALRGDFETAAVLHKEALDLAQEAGARDAQALVRKGLARGARRQGDYDRASDLYKSALAYYQEAGSAAEIAAALEGLACVAADRQEPERAAVLLGAAESIRAQAQAQLAPQERTDVEQATATAGSALGQEAFTAALEQGRRMSVRELLASGG
jgi:predicted ATPase/DNA-binding SARP family transcriptional activator/tetratricopeptide (TPR) repeat protein